MKIYNSIFIFVLITMLGKAQTFPWAKSATSPTNAAGEGWALSKDPGGNVFAAGYFIGSTIAFGTNTLTNAGGVDGFLVKYDATGNVLWAKSMGGTGNDPARSVTSDAAGNVYITGIFSSPTIVFGSTTLTNSASNNNIFVCKCDANGNVLWAKNAGGVNDQTYGISADPSGNIIITGIFYSATIAFGTTTLTNVVGTGTGNVFVVKYDPNGNVLWAKNAGGSGGNTIGISVSSDSWGNIFVTGNFNCSSVAFGTNTLSTSGSGAVFLVKYDINGNVLWAKSAGSSILDASNSVSADASGGSYITGIIYSPTMIFGTYTLTNAGSKNAFITKYDSNGNVLWAKSVVGTATNIGYSVSSYTGGVFVSGSFTNSIALGAYTLTPPVGSTDPMFIALYDVSGNIICAQALASGGDDNNAVCADGLGNAFLVGDFMANPFAVGSNTFALTGTEDFFIARFSCQPSATGIKALDMISVTTTVFPNPNGGMFSLDISNQIENGEIVLINSRGQKVHEQKASRGKNNITTHSLDSGLYSYIIFQNKTVMEHGKLIIE